MTIGKGPRRGQEVAVASSKLPDVLQPVPLPIAITETRPDPSSRGVERWHARDLLLAEAVGVQQALVALEAGKQPAEPNDIRWHIGKLLSHWDTNQSAVVKDEIIKDWGRDLTKAAYSAANIAGACEVWRTTKRFRPQVSEILDICRNLAARDGEHVRRAKVLLGIEPPRHWENPPPAQHEGTRITPDMWATLGAKLRRPSSPAPRLREPRAPSIGDVRAQLAKDRDAAAVEKLASMTSRPIKA